VSHRERSGSCSGGSEGGELGGLVNYVWSQDAVLDNCPSRRGARIGYHLPDKYREGLRRFPDSCRETPRPVSPAKELT
jgi:hypothetical protein